MAKSLLFLLTFTLSACGGMAADAPSANNSSAKVTLELPSGVSLKPGGKMISANPKFNAAKITSISLKVTAPDLTTPITGAIPLDTLELSLDVTSGNARTFTVTVTTDTGLSFSGSKTVDLVANASIDLAISVTVADPATTSTTATSSVPSAPTGVAATAGNAQATVSWTAVTGATSYNVYYSATSGAGTGGTKVTGHTSGNAITGLTNGTTYYFVVTAVNAAGESTASSQVSATPQVPTPSAPTSVSATAGDGRVAVSWTAVTGATSYNVYYSVTAGAGTAGTKVTGHTSGSAITGLTNGTTYYFVVTAVNAGGEGAFSTQVSATPQVSAPSSPTGVAATAGNAQATVSWTAVSGATSYNVYYSPTSGAGTGGTKVTGHTSGNAITGLTNGTTYYFVVTAVNAGGESASSSQVFATPAYLMGGGVQNGGLILNNASTVAVSTLAGTALSAGTTDATGTVARFGRPYGITSDGTNLFVADQTNNTIRKIVIATGVVTTIAGSGTAASTDGTGTLASFNSPTGITTDGTNLFVTDLAGNTVRKIVISTGVVTTVAGSGIAALTDGTGTAASFSTPNGIVTDGANLFVADQANNVVRKIVISTGVVTTFATGFTAPRGITTDGTNLFIANSGGNIIQKIVISTGAVTTVAGSGAAGSADGTGTAATFKLPVGITTDGTNLYVVDNNNHTIRKIVISTGVVTTIAGAALTSGSTDGTGTAARFKNPLGVTTNGSNLFVADGSNFTVRKIVPLMGGAVPKPLASGGVVTTFAGSAGISGSTDATGTAARFTTPNGITTDGANLYVVDFGNYTIRKIVISTGAVTTIAGSAGVTGSADGTGTAATFNGPTSITTDGTNLYVADFYNNTIRMIVISSGVVTTLAGAAGTSGFTNATGAAARFNGPWGITMDGTYLYVAEANNQAIRKVEIATGIVTTVASSLNSPRAITTDGTYLYVTEYASNAVDKILIATGATATLASGSGFNSPHGIVTDGTNLYVDNLVGHQVHKVVIATGVVTTFAGSGTAGSTDATGTSAQFNGPVGITTDGTSLYLTDATNRTIRKIQ
ncbi:MAG: fibronectin type III domain-containing protein [Nitrospinae bacterium]|nr:fibronectin type III domain-containing protein [Nitrospinota bacterium]